MTITVAGFNPVVITAVSAYMAHMRERLTIDASRLAAIVESSADPVVGMELDGSGCSLRVQDSGPGIEPNLRTTVFEPFFQGESAGHRQFTQGAGLGPSLVREMLHALGGSIELSSEVGVGSTFRISVPRARPSQIEFLTAEQTRNTA